MRIAIVSTFPPGKGSLNEYAFHFVNHLRHKPEVSEIYILADELPSGESYPDVDKSGGAPIYYETCWKFGALDNALRIRSAVRKINPDIVLQNLQFATFADKRIAGALGLLSPMLVKSNSTVSTVLLHNIMETVDLNKAGFGGNPIIETITRLAGNIFTRLILRADLVAVTIPKYVEILTSKYNVEHVVLGPHGAFEEIPQPEFKLPDGPLQIMTFGKFGTYKKIEALIEAFIILQNEMDTPLELVIAGSDSPNTPGYIEGVRETYKHVENIRYTGYVAEEDVPRIFQDSAVVVFPYNSTTGSSGVLHQAGSYGRAVVLPNLGDLAELIEEEGYQGAYFEPDDPKTMAEAIKTFLVDEERRNEVGLRNYTAAAGLPMYEVVDWYLLHFERLMNQRKSITSMKPQEVS